MGWMNQIGNMLERYSGSGTTPPPASVNEDFSRVAQTVPQQDLGQAVSAAMRSDQTPPFGQIIGNLFGQSNDQQKAGILNQLVTGLGGAIPPALSSLFPGGGQQITPQQASSISPEAATQLAEHANTQNPSIVDTAGNFYAQHPQLVQGLGAVALATMMSHLSRR